MKLNATLALFMSVLVLGACVPKTQYEDQEKKLKIAQETITELEEAKQICDPDTFLQLQEQSQSLDLLQQELIDRNTELSEEVARLRIYEAQAKSQDSSCFEREQALQREYEAQLGRVKATYEDLIEELKKQIQDLKQDSKQKPKKP